MAKFLTYIKPFIDNYKKQVIDEDFIKININNIFANNNLQKESVLCIGEVQSDKTKNIIECVKYAVNNNYNIIIVLGGVTNLLLEQSKKRLIEDLSYHEVIARVIDAKENLYHNIETCLSKNIPVVVLTLKGSYQLEELLNSINNCNIIDKKILIIDDECDFGSINVSKNNDFQSLLYKKICNLFSRIKYGKLLSFTATPFSNILSDKSWILKPDRIVSLISYTDYCGCEKFNNSDCYLLIDNDKNDFDWKILKKTFIYWLLCTSVMLLDIDKGIYSGSAKSELLINVSYENNKQEEILEILKKIFDEFYSSDYRNIRYWILDYLIKIGFEISPYSVDELINKVKFIYNQVSINKNECFILLNREGDSAEKFSKNKNNFLIIVSGFMASRGVTFKYLICELFLNSSENCTKIDSLLQKCRWFGNRKNTMKYMRILLNQGIKDSLFYAQKYINLFKGGNVYTLKNLKSELLDLDYESKKNKWKVISTENGKRK
ncbi:Z1 domain-containing protein [Malacoplasma iowae]|uniref:Z1 domain-containing protein n=1 Tax=Malacoplasma iowae TaxID=2116 RepID=UPI002A187609|nr:Z1 domain-containing protein [Malacoplasma iowae]WPL40373.1 Z1 domain-containing protein [Malacoplasma iowae]